MEGNDKDNSFIFATCVISGFRREVGENCALLRCYAACSGNSLQMFRDNLSVPSSKVKVLSKFRPKGYPETSVWIYHYTLRNITEEESSHLLGFLTLEEGTNRLSRNVGAELQVHAA
jgi:hypothetical protein